MLESLTQSEAPVKSSSEEQSFERLSVTVISAISEVSQGRNSSAEAPVEALATPQARSAPTPVGPVKHNFEIQTEKLLWEWLIGMGTVRTAVTYIVLTAIFVLVGAWCPQESAVGQEKIIEQFGTSTAETLIKLGVTDLFHTPLFLLDIALLSVSITVASFRKVFPRLKQLKQRLPLLAEPEVNRLPVHDKFLVNDFPGHALSVVASQLKKSGYTVHIENDKLVAEWGKFSRTAASVTHVGLMTLLVGVTISSWTGFSGFQPVRLGEKLSFATSDHSKLWIGELPKFQLLVKSTRREDYPTGQAKQWYSDLAVIDPSGKVLATQEISVNNPLSYGGVDTYQSTWGMDQIVLSFNGQEKKLDLRPMGQRYAAFLPLDPSTVLIFSIKEQDQPLRIFAKRPEWPSPRMLTQITPGGSVKLGSVVLKYIRPVPVTGLQYKCDPGLPITYIAFGFIMLGVSLAAFPHRKIWAATRVVQHADGTSTMLAVGGVANKAKVGFERSFAKLLKTLTVQFKDAGAIAGSQVTLRNEKSAQCAVESEHV
jgi:cytochrome c biogenesis protein